MAGSVPIHLSAKPMMTVLLMPNARTVFALAEQDLMETDGHVGMLMSVRMEPTNVPNSQHVQIHLVSTLVPVTLVSSATAYHVNQL